MGSVQRNWERETRVGALASWMRSYSSNSAEDQILRGDVLEQRSGSC